MFFMTYARSFPDEIVPYAEENDIPLMTNGAHRYSYAKDEFLDMFEYDTFRVVDSGGYNLLAKWVRDRLDENPAQLQKEHTIQAIENNPQEYKDEMESEYPFIPFSVEKYDSWLTDHMGSFWWAASVDYACEKKFDPLLSKEHKIQLTIRNTKRQFDRNPAYTMLPVLQGRNIDDYIRCYNEYQDYGIPVRHVGLGTVCRISETNELVSLEEKLYERTDIEKIHAFGVKTSAYKKGATFHSADSQAWVRAASNGNEYQFNKDKIKLDKIPEPDNSRKRTLESFKEYYKYVKYLQNHQKMQCVNCEGIYQNHDETDNQMVVRETLDKRVCPQCADNIIGQVV